jgi:DNA-binding response OmpR family regulator
MVTGGVPEAGRILVVDDDETVSEVVARYLARDGFAVERVADGYAALAADERDPPDLIVLDLMLPGLPGLEVCRRLRARSDVPIVMLTARGEEADRIVGLEVGADDYVVKPFSPRELALRVASVLRRYRRVEEQPAPAPLVDDDLRLDPASRSATLGDQPLALTVREFDLLAYFLRHPGRVFDRAELLRRVWDWDFGDQSTVTVHVRRLRQKIEEEPSNPRRIVTVWGVGYRYEEAGQ